MCLWPEKDIGIFKYLENCEIKQNVKIKMVDSQRIIPTNFLCLLTNLKLESRQIGGPLLLLQSTLQTEINYCKRKEEKSNAAIGKLKMYGLSCIASVCLKLRP